VGVSEDFARTYGTPDYVSNFKQSSSFDSGEFKMIAIAKHQGLQDAWLMLKPKNPCPVCGAETRLAEIEPHPLHLDFEIHGYLCDRCGPIKSLVVLRSDSEIIRRPAD
jgi:hypothetical protein